LFVWCLKSFTTIISLFCLSCLLWCIHQTYDVTRVYQSSIKKPVLVVLILSILFYIEFSFVWFTKVNKKRRLKQANGITYSKYFVLINLVKSNNIVMYSSSHWSLWWEVGFVASMCWVWNEILCAMYKVHHEHNSHQ
jgi:hypothetical protein